MKELNIKIRNELKEDLVFFNYDLITIAGDDAIKIIAHPLEDVTKDNIEAIEAMLVRYLIELDVEYSKTLNGDTIMIKIEKPKVSKSLDGLFSEIDIKSQDDAIDASKVTFNKFTSYLDKFTKGLTKLFEDARDLDNVDLAIDLSESSPFRKLVESGNITEEALNDIWNNLPKFMYFKHELENYEKEYSELLEQVIRLRELQFAEVLKKLITELTDLKTSEVSEEEVSHIMNEIKKTVIAQAEAWQVEIDSNSIQNRRTIDQLITDFNRIVGEIT